MQSPSIGDKFQSLVENITPFINKARLLLNYVLDGNLLRKEYFFRTVSAKESGQKLWNTIYE